MFTNCTKEDLTTEKEVNINGVVLGEKTNQVLPILSSEFGVETTWRITLSDNGEVSGFFSEMETSNSFSKDNFQKLISNIESTYKISFSLSNETENHVDYIAIMNSSTSFIYRQYKSTYWSGAIIGIYDTHKYGGNINDELIHVVFKDGKLWVYWVNSGLAESNLSDVSADFVIIDSNGKEVFKRNYIKPIDIINGIDVALSLGTYIINYNPSKTSANIQGKTFAIKDTLKVSKDGFIRERLNYKDAYYTLQINVRGVQSLEGVAINFPENNGTSIWDWNWWQNGAWEQGSIFFNGYDPFSENNQKQFQFIRIHYKERNTYFNFSSQIDYQKYESNNSFMEFDFAPSTGLIRKK